MTTAHTVNPCRICGAHGSLAPIHSFGLQPVAGYLEDNLEAARRAPRFENAIGICRTCHLVQQMNDDAHDVLCERVYSEYQRTYSMSQQVSAYLDGFVGNAFKVAGVQHGDSVIEIGSNDGSLLHLVADRGGRAFGFDPSASESGDSSIVVVRDFFTEQTAREFAAKNGPVQLVVSRHTLEHAFQPLDFVRGIRAVLASDGCAVVEIPYVVHQIMRNQFQSFTFQHISFFSVHSMVAIAAAAQLVVAEVRFVEMDGGSMVVVLRPANGRADTPAGVRLLLDLERTLGYTRTDPYQDYFESFGREKNKIRDVLSVMNREGTHVVGYGAGSKGQALVNMLELDRDRLAAVIDDTPGAAGKYVPGVALPVIGRDDDLARKAACVFVTAPTHAKEIVAKQRLERNDTVYLATMPRFCSL
jgi:methylation protein EvaC